MATTTPGSEGELDLVGLISGEIAKARKDAQPTSRQMLAEIIHERTSMPVGEALQLVDTYCDEQEPGIPYYLQEEIAIPYLKFIAAVFVLIGIGFLWYGAGIWRAKQPAHVWFSIGTVIVGLGAFAWVQSLEKFAARRRKRRAGN